MQNWRQVSWVLAAFLIALAPGMASAAQREDQVLVRGCARDIFGNPVQNATVHLNGTNYRGGAEYNNDGGVSFTDGSGNFEIFMKKGAPNTPAAAQITVWNTIANSRNKDRGGYGEKNVSNIGSPVPPDSCIQVSASYFVGVTITGKDTTPRNGGGLEIWLQTKEPPDQRTTVINQNGIFDFSAFFAKGTPYTIRVVKQPEDENCYLGGKEEANGIAGEGKPDITSLGLVIRQLTITCVKDELRAAAKRLRDEQALADQGRDVYGAAQIALRICAESRNSSSRDQSCQTAQRDVDTCNAHRADWINRRRQFGGTAAKYGLEGLEMPPCPSTLPGTSLTPMAAIQQWNQEDALAAPPGVALARRGGSAERLDQGDKQAELDKQNLPARQQAERDRVAREEAARKAKAAQEAEEERRYKAQAEAEQRKKAQQSSSGIVEALGVIAGAIQARNEARNNASAPSDYRAADVPNNPTRDDPQARARAQYEKDAKKAAKEMDDFKREQAKYYPMLTCAFVSQKQEGKKMIPCLQNNCGRPVEVYFTAPDKIGGAWTIGGGCWGASIGTTFNAVCERDDFWDSKERLCKRP